MFETAIRTTIIDDRKKTSFPSNWYCVWDKKISTYQWAIWSLYLHTHSRMQDRIRKREVRKQQMAQDKDWVINEEKVWKNPNDLQRLSTSHQQASAQPVPKQQLLYEDHPPALLLSLMWSGIKSPLGQLGSALPAVSLSQTPAHPQPTPWQGSERNRGGLDIVQALLSKSVISSVLVTNLQRGNIQAAMKKSICSPTTPSTELNPNFCLHYLH